jgi:hypothetical protein
MMPMTTFAEEFGGPLGTAVTAGRGVRPAPQQCLYFFPLPQVQGSLRAGTGAGVVDMERVKPGAKNLA